MQNKDHGNLAECLPIYLVLAPVLTSIFVSHEHVVLVLLRWDYFFPLPNLLAPRRHSYICCQVHSSLKINIILINQVKSRWPDKEKNFLNYIDLEKSSQEYFYYFKKVHIMLRTPWKVNTDIRVRLNNKYHLIKTQHRQWI